MTTALWKIIRANSEDLETVDAMCARFHVFEDIDLAPDLRRAAIERLLIDKSLGGIWVIGYDEKIAGYLAICLGFSIEFGGHDAFVDELYLEPEFRGLGGGKFALTAIQAELASLDVKALHLEVAKKNTRARRLYDQAGFKPRNKYILMTTG